MAVRNQNPRFFSLISFFGKLIDPGELECFRGGLSSVWRHKIMTILGKKNQN